MSVIDQITEHFESFGRQHIDVPEWGKPNGPPVAIYWRPMTIADRRKVTKRGQDPDISMFVDVLLLKALDAEGGPMFREEDRFTLMNRAESSVITRVASAILAVPSIEDAEKN